MPLVAEIGQMYQSQTNMSTSLGCLGITCRANYHEWNVEHDQNRSA